MEQLVLGIFKEQLSKIIIDFRKEQVNANLLNGKGEIRDVSLNCAVLNESIAKVSPYVRLEEIHVSRIGFHVTSWTNLRKAPIIVDIGDVIARMQESLSILPRNERHEIQMITETELIKKISEGFKPFSVGHSYGLVDRIVDNLVIDIESFKLEFQTCGKFKTRRPGPWTPPLFQMEMKNLKVCMVDAEGCEGTPDQVWEHNRARKDSFLMYRKVSGECRVRLFPQDQSFSENENEGLPKELANLRIEIQTAVERRLRDGAVLACQLDVTIPDVTVDIDSSDIRQLAHFASGLKYCLGKDKSFEDPLKPFVESDILPSLANPTTKNQSQGDAAELLDSSEEISDDNDNDANVVGDFNDATNNDFDLNSIQDGGSVTSSGSDNGIAEDADSSVFNDESSTHGSSNPIPADRPRNQRSVIILPNGLVIYNSVSFTCSVPEFMLRGSYLYDGEKACLEFLAKGIVAEVIWPKTNREQGLYAQFSTSFVSLQERISHHKRTLLLGGMQRDDHLSRHLPSPKPQDICADDFFPLFERRGIRDDPLDLRHLFPTQAFGLKTTVDILNQANENETLGSFMVFHEIGVDEMDVVLDTTVLLRMTRFIMDMDGKGFDPRWDTGDWIELLTPEMLHNPSETLHLNECLQECTQLFLDENLMISSDLFNVTARLSNIEMRIPSAVQDSLRSCDIILKWKETTFVVSSALPRTFLTGRIGNSISGDERRDQEKVVIDFPNDPSDICYRYGERSTGQGVSTFRSQLTTRGFEVNIVPVVPFCKAPEAQNLLAIGESTLIFCFEGEPPTTGSNKMKITVFLSILIQELILNIDFDILAGATCTLLCHKKNIVAIIEMFGETIVNSQDALSDTTKIKQGMRGQRILAKRHISQSRETGGLVIIFCLQQRHFQLKVWRQNVPISSPLRDGLASSNISKCQNEEGCIDLLSLVDFEMRDLEVGIEFDFHSNSGHRTVIKSFVKNTNLKVVDLAKEIEDNIYRKQKPSSGGVSGEKDNTVLKRNLKDLCCFGNESLPCGLDPSGRAQHFAFRLEAHHKNNSQSWSMAADVSAPSTINLDAEAVKTTTFLIIEALLLPAWSKDPVMANDIILFPPDTIGAMFYSVAADLIGDQKNSLLDLNSLELDTDSGEPIVERVLQSICKLFLPSNLQVILLRCEIANVIISIPSENKGKQNQSSKVSFLLNQSDIITRFYPIPGSIPSEIEQVLACKGTDWSTLINTDKKGFYQSIFSRQSLLSMTEGKDGTILEKVVQPFEVSLTYSGATVDLSMNKGILIDDIRLIENIQSRLKSAVMVSSECLSEISIVIRAMMRRDPTEISAPEPPQTLSDENKSNGERDLFLESSAVSGTRAILQRANEEFSIYEHDVRNSMQRKDNELESIKIDLFNKERERFGALALLSSRVAGWIRMGGRHRSGQRVMKKSLLWPFWAMLRKEILILYPRPGEPKPSDIISLVNARILTLSGGNSKQDTKRGFAIVESSGMIRYFVTGTAQEYELWTKQINFTIRSFSDPTKLLDTEGVIESDISKSNEIGMDNEKDIAAGGSKRNNGIGNILSSAFQSAKFKSKEMANQRQSVFAIDQSTQDDDSSILSNVILGGSEANDGNLVQDSTLATSRRAEISKKLSGVGQVTKNRFGSAIQNARQKRDEISNRRKTEDSSSSISEKSTDVHGDHASSMADLDTINALPIDQDLDDNRGPTRARTGLKLGNKLGSAIQNARMKAKGNIEKSGRLSNFRGKLGELAQGRSDDMRLIQSEPQFDSSDKSGAVDCNLVNEDDSDHHEIEVFNKSGSERKVTSPQRENSDKKISILESLPDGSVGRNAESSRESPTSSFRSRDAGKQEEKNSFGSRFSFRKQRDSALNNSLFGGESLTLKNIYIDPETTLLDNAFDQEVRPLNVYKEKWVVKVSEISNIAEPKVVNHDTELCDGIGIAKEKEKLSNIVNNVDGKDKNKESIVASYEKKDEAAENEKLEISDGVDGIQSSLEEVGVQEKIPISEASTPQERCDTERIDQARHPRSQQDVPRFVVKALRVKYTQPDLSVEKQWSFGDVLKLYSGVSEAIEDELPQLIGTYSYDWDKPSIQSAGRPSSAVLTEKMIAWGRILGGLLATGEDSECIEGFGQYQCESIENFLNSLLECPLPVDALKLLSKTLGINCPTKNIESSINDYSSGLNETNPRATESGDDCEDINEPKRDMTEKPKTYFTSPGDRSGKILNLLSACGAELHQAETRNAVVEGIQHIGVLKNAKASSTVKMKPIFYDPLLPPSLTEYIHNSLHKALVDVLAERDEVHAQLIGANVMHTHSLERMRKKMERLEVSATLSQEITRVQRQQDLQSANIANLFGKADQRIEKLRKAIDKKIERVHHIIRNDDTDIEMKELCSQLASEITIRTSHALKIERLERTRDAERKTEATEKEALKVELRHAQGLLKSEREKSSEAIAEAAHWKSLYEKCQADDKNV